MWERESVAAGRVPQRRGALERSKSAELVERNPDRKEGAPHGRGSVQNTRTDDAVPGRYEATFASHAENGPLGTGSGANGASAAVGIKFARCSALP
jgi:hypothetical protein